MSIRLNISNLKKQTASVDWKLLAFLILFLDVKLGVKIAALVLIYLLQFNFKFGFKPGKSRLPLFYVIAIAIAVFNWLISGSYSNLNYNMVLLTGIGFWLLCILAIHQVKLAVERNAPAVVHNTVQLFFVINAAVSLFVLLSIIREVHTINPFRYQGQFQKYFIGTGDFIKGITFDVSITNAVINAFGVIYFLVKKNAGMVLLCMAILLLTGSNTINLMLIGILALLFAFNSTRDQKSIIVICAMFLAVFMIKVSPQNDDYVSKMCNRIFHQQTAENKVILVNTVPITEKPDNQLTVDERKEKIAMLYLDSSWKSKVKITPAQVLAMAVKPVIPVPSIHTAPFQNKPDTTAERSKLITFVNGHKAELPTAQQADINITTPGKVIAIKQTIAFLKQHPQKIILGDGMGNFSSKLAFKATALGVAGGFPARFAYINNSFLINHLDVYLNFFGRRASYHSLINSPNSVYDQLLAEYGLIGVLAFAIYYIGYFFKHYKILTYGIPIILLMGGIFMIDYWFEQLSVIVFFELLLMLNIKESEPKTLIYGNE